MKLTMPNMLLKRIRIIVAIVFFTAITLLFLDFTGTIHLWLGWLAKIQLMPAILTASIAIIVFIAILTLLFGRIYCSIICPLGIFQDIVSRLASKRKKNRFTYSPALDWLRYGMLGVFIVLFIIGIHSAVALLEPYSAYGRITSNLFAPFYQWGNNLLAYFAGQVDSYAFYSVEVWLPGLVTFVAASLIFTVLIVLAWLGGRTYCNTVCPVGSVLGLLSRFSLFKLTFDTGKCKKCGLCEWNCKASCIDVKNLTIDGSRCVTCFKCMEKCKFGAMKYAPVKIGKKQNVGSEMVGKENSTNDGVSRRSFLSVAGIFAFAQTVKAQQLRGDGGLADILDKKIPVRKTPIVPPGATGLRNMNKYCTACQLCVSVCPTNVLRPSAKLATLMQPEMSYEKGYCRPECTKCSQVCPTGAIRAITPADKSAISIGKAVWIKDNCIVNRDEVQCNSCANNCPTGAIMLIAVNQKDKNSLRIPIIDGELCIGCGACENLCPARPFSAVYVEGNVVHHSV
ncbi:MAG: 4Fe-4S dicluster domain-containing protein [Bacteroidales bacterium]|jgi:ferredoxin|nr:4Fe-4S dicluster domain-containing protein [Bacteroidales bacterium]